MAFSVILRPFESRQSNNGQTKFLCPIGHITHRLVTSIGVIRGDEPAIARLLDNSTHHGTVFSVDSKPFPQGGIVHLLPVHIFQTAMQIACPNPVAFIHIPKFLVGKKNRSGMTVSPFEYRSGQLVILGLVNDLVHTTSSFFANANSPKERSQNFIAASGG